jgi:hypothetical protein
MVVERLSDLSFTKLFSPAKFFAGFFLRLRGLLLANFDA